jgi:hypothetical protein
MERKNCSVKYDIVMPNASNKDKNTIVDSAQEIVFTDVKCITKQQYSSDLWPLKIKRNCIVDKSLAVRIFADRQTHRQITRSTFVLVFVMPNE